MKGHWHAHVIFCLHCRGGDSRAAKLKVSTSCSFLNKIYMYISLYVLEKRIVRISSIFFNWAWFLFLVCMKYLSVSLNVSVFVHMLQI